MIKFVWSAVGIGLWLYVTNIITQYGFLSYFKVPPNFIDISLTSNVVFYYQIIELMQAIFGAITLPLWIIIGVCVLFLIYFWASNRFWAKTIEIVGTVILGILILGSFHFGHFLAVNGSTFDVPDTTGCISVGADTSFVVIAYKSTQAILVPIDETTRKMTGGYIVREVSQIPCKLVKAEVGKITE